ncbi:MAG: regulatory protein RecX [Bacteroidota bacterium]|nr:regulatory protein RecX [Bacteroidota bacterium]MDP3144704.1 regulatory protein RecX [Bacteroidota bacterium]MDP3557923.1 regulatory protein RecX [Bacteroidota bacterium]
MDFKEHKVKKLLLSPEIAEQKIKSWCAYQERSQNETRYKLKEYGLFDADVEQIISKLISENYLNEERFAIALAGGKFRIKHWGKIKIKIELRKHKISDYLINKALTAISDEDYLNVINLVSEKKIKQVKLNDKQKLFYSTLNYLVSRGFERDLVIEELNKLLK